VERDRLAASAAGAIESGSIVIADGVRLASCRTTRRTLSVVDWRSPEVTGVVGVLKLGAAKSEPSTSSISNNTNEKTQTTQMLYRASQTGERSRGRNPSITAGEGEPSRVRSQVSPRRGATLGRDLSSLGCLGDTHFPVASV